MSKYGRKWAERPGKDMAKSLMGRKMLDPTGQISYHINIERIAMPKRFKDINPEEARKFLIKYLNEVVLPEDGVRDEGEEAARETMFNRLTELEHVVRDLKKKMRHG